MFVVKLFTMQIPHLINLLHGDMTAWRQNLHERDTDTFLKVVSLIVLDTHSFSEACAGNFLCIACVAM